MTTSTPERMNVYSRALERFGRWLADHSQPDGSLDLTSRACPAYMPLPVYAQAVSDNEGLARSLLLIQQRCHNDAESFLYPPSRSLLPYRTAWMLFGAILGEHLHLAAWLEQWTLRFSHRDTGALFGTEEARQSGQGEICFDSTTTACAALCVSGNMAEAERMGEFLRRLVRAQPHAERRFLCGWDTNKELLTQFDPKQARLYVIEWEQSRQYLYKIGLLVRAFALLHARTGRREYLDLAESLYCSAVTKSPNVWGNTLAHKLGWAAYTLALITRKPEYTEDACRVADHVASLQQPEGAFHYPEFWPLYEQVTVEQKCNIGAQFATWIAYARTLLLRCRGPVICHRR